MKLPSSSPSSKKKKTTVFFSLNKSFSQFRSPFSKTSFSLSFFETYHQNPRSCVVQGLRLGG